MNSPKKVSAVTQKLPGGWKRRIYLRTTGASAGRKDVVLITPDNLILRSNVEIERYAKNKKLKLDPKVFTVSLGSVENIFKREAEILLAQAKTPVSSPRQNENKQHTNSNSRRSSLTRSYVLTEASPINVIRKSLGKDETPRKRGRPLKNKSATAERRFCVLTEATPSNIIKKSLGQGEMARRRGRPSKNKSATLEGKLRVLTEAALSSNVIKKSEGQLEMPRKRGRPRKNISAKLEEKSKVALGYVIRKSVGKDNPPRKRGRPLKSKTATFDRKSVQQSLALFRRKNLASARAESKLATKRRRSGDSGIWKDEKRGKYEDLSAFAAIGRQTRNSISLMEFPILSPKNKKHRASSEPSKQLDKIHSVQLDGSLLQKDRHNQNTSEKLDASDFEDINSGEEETDEELDTSGEKQESDQEENMLQDETLEPSNGGELFEVQVY